MDMCALPHLEDSTLQLSQFSYFSSQCESPQKQSYRQVSASSPRDASHTPSPQWQSAMQLSPVSLQNGTTSPELWLRWE